MSNLPNIDTSTASMMAYWNAIEQGGVDSIEPSEVTSDGSIIQYTAYDNGVDGTYQLPEDREARFRVKTDGWMVVWIDDTETYGLNTTDPTQWRGPWEFAGPPGNEALGNDRLSRAINSLRQELSNSGSMNFSYAQVGIYDWSEPDTSTISLFHAELDGGSSTQNEWDALSWTSTTEFHRHAITGRTGQSGGSSGTGGYVDFYYEGGQSGSTSRLASGNSDERGVDDGLSYSLDGGTDYYTELYVTTHTDAGSGDYAWHSHLFWWS